MQFDWPYYTFRNGFLFDESGKRVKSIGGYPVTWFGTIVAAELFLEEHNLRGNVR